MQKTAIAKQGFWAALRLHAAIPAFVAGILAACIARFQLEISAGTPAQYMAQQWPVFAGLNALTAFCVTLLLFAFIGRWWLSTALSGAAFTVLSLVDYYTRDLHGSALMPQDVLNLGTAAEVLGSYKLQITPEVWQIILFYLPVLGICYFQYLFEKPVTSPAAPISWKLRGVRILGCAAGIFAVLYIGYFSPNPVKPAKTYTWAWQETYYPYGYLAGSIESFLLMRDPIQKPDGYTDAAATEAADIAAHYIPAVPTAAAEDYPDVFLILSESFYDFSLVTDLNADASYNSVITSLPNSIYGHTVSPHVGGGTNSTEYEMLTSNSMMLMPSITPFNWLNLHSANSVVSVLKNLGYTTMAAHPYTNTNYRRDTAWLTLGFDETHFEADFTTKEYYGDRIYQTDSATYRDLLAMYDAMPQDKPRFTFLVSIQSHGDYDMNAPAQDLIHAGTDYGEYDTLMDEYLSCMYLSDRALGELTDALTERYEKTGRKAIIAFAGDHAPSFVSHVADPAVTGGDSNALEILERSTPYVIWANYPLENAGQANPTDPYNRMDMCDLTPTLLEAAGLPLTSYYRYILSMKQSVPLQTAGNDYMAADGKAYHYGENPDSDRLMRGYFALEYNNIGTGAHRDDALYRPAD